MARRVHLCPGMSEYTQGVSISKYPIGYRSPTRPPHTDIEFREELITRGLLVPREEAIPLRHPFLRYSERCLTLEPLRCCVCGALSVPSRIDNAARYTCENCPWTAFQRKHRDGERLESAPTGFELVPVVPCYVEAS